MSRGESASNATMLTCLGKDVLDGFSARGAVVPGPLRSPGWFLDGFSARGTVVPGPLRSPGWFQCMWCSSPWALRSPTSFYMLLPVWQLTVWTSFVTHTCQDILVVTSVVISILSRYASSSLIYYQCTEIVPGSGCDDDFPLV